MKSSLMVAALLAAGVAGIVYGARYLDLIGVIKRMHGM